MAAQNVRNICSRLFSEGAFLTRWQTPLVQSSRHAGKMRSGETIHINPDAKCVLCGHMDQIDYKNIRLLNQFVSKQSGMILPRNTTGVCPKAQRKLAKSIKRARQFGLMPYLTSVPKYLADPTAPQLRRK